MSGGCARRSCRRRSGAAPVEEAVQGRREEGGGGDDDPHVGGQAVRQGRVLQQEVEHDAAESRDGVGELLRHRPDPREAGGCQEERHQAQNHADQDDLHRPEIL